MIKNEKIKKLIYFFIPNLLYLSIFSYFYNSIYSASGDAFEILFREVLLLSLIYFVIFGLLYLIMSIKLDYIKTSCLILSLILLSFEFVYSSIILWVIIMLLNIIVFKVDNSISEKIMFFVSYVVVMLFMFNFFVAVQHYFATSSRYEDKDVKIKLNIEDKISTPNIYWIHCDGMINLSDIKKYFKYDDSSFEEFLEKNNFYVNEGAAFYSGGHTIQALISLYNPTYYDEIFEEYLNNLKENDLNSWIISYDKMNDKRINNELFEAFKEKNYKLVSISDFNQYSSFYTDYMFDYYTFQKSSDKSLKYFTINNNAYKDIENYTYYAHLKTLVDTTFLHFLTDNYNFLNYEVVNYDEYNFENYEYIKESEYWKSKAILKSLSMVYNQETESNLFTFIDFDINHTPWLYDLNGKKVNSNKEGFLPENYLNNYIHSTNLLMDIIKYIKDKDSNGIIILQSDHGIHTVSTSIVADYVGVSTDDLSELKESTFSAIYIPNKYINGDEKYLDNPLNISRYLVNTFIGNNYEYIEQD